MRSRRTYIGDDRPVRRLSIIDESGDSSPYGRLATIGSHAVNGVAERRARSS